MREARDRVRSLTAKVMVSTALIATIAIVAALFTGAGTAGTTQQRAAVGGYIYAGSAAQTRLARAAGLRDAKSAVTVPKSRTIGVIQLSGTSSQSIGVLATARQIAKMFGWKVVVCDPNFDPQKVAQCATSIVAQNPSVVFSVSTNTGAMGSGFQDAVDRGIPWISVISGVVPARGLRDYGTDGFALAKIIDTYLIREMRARNTQNPRKLFAIEAPTVGIASANSSKQLAADAQAAGDVEVIHHDLDLSNAVQDTLTTSKQALQQDPNLAGMWTLCDFCLPLMAQEVGQAQGANRKTVVAGLYANPQAVEGIRNGTIDAVSDCPWLSSVWVGMDQVLQNLTRKTPVASTATVYKKYKLQFMRPYVIGTRNVGNFGAVIPVYGPDYQTYFTTKWRQEFGIK
jgi:ABC-type sugar transport system substrate-binding protein